MANDLQLKPISAPGLGQPGYGRGMEKTFENIDSNFKIVGNHDFVKGDTGYSMKSTSVSLVRKEISRDETTGVDTVTDIITSDGILVLKTIFSLYLSEEEIRSVFDPLLAGNQTEIVKSVFKSRLSENDVPVAVRNVDITKSNITTTLSVVDYLTEGCMFNVISIYDPVNETDVNVVGSTNDFVFKDARFVLATNYQDGTYSDLYDFTCTVHLSITQETNPDTAEKTYHVGYEVLQNTPTLYYDNEQQFFCWRVFNVETGIAAQGPQGTPGKDSVMHIVGIEWPINSDEPSQNNASVFVIKKAIKGDGWKEVGSEDLKQSEVNGWEGDACIVIATRTTRQGDEEQTLEPHVFASEIVLTGTSKVAGVYCAPENSIQTQTNAAIVRSAFYGITFEHSTQLNALFVPIRDGSDHEHTPIHAIWSAPVNNNTPGEQNARPELHITPFGSYNSIQTVGEALGKVGEPENETQSGKRLDKVIGRYSHPAITPRIMIDYPQVIISGEKNIEGTRVSALGIGTTFLDKLIDPDSTSYAELNIPRIKVGAKGVVQIGANNEESNNNNQGQLIVHTIYSSLKSIAKTYAGDTGCSLDLVGTNGQIFLGESTLSTGVYSYAPLYANKSIQVTPSFSGDSRFADSGARIKLNADLGAVQLYGTESMTTSIQFVEMDTTNNTTVGDASISFDAMGDEENTLYIKTSPIYSAKTFISTNMSRIQMTEEGDNTKYDTTTLSNFAPVCRGSIWRQVIHNWPSSTGSTQTFKFGLHGNFPTSSRQFMILEGDTTRDWTSDTWEWSCSWSGELPNNITVFSKAGNRLKMRFVLSREYKTWGCTISGTTRTVWCTVYAVLFKKNAQGDWLEVSRKQIGISTVDANTDGVPGNQSQGQTKISYHSFDIPIDKFSFTTGNTGDYQLGIYYKCQFRDQVWRDTRHWSGTNFKFYVDQWKSTGDNTYDGGRTFGVDAHGPQSSDAIFKTEFGKGLVLMGVNRHRNIGLYSTSEADATGTALEAAEKNNNSYGLYLSFSGIPTSSAATDRKDGFVFIPAGLLYEKLFNRKPTDWADDIQYSNLPTYNPGSNPAPGKRYIYPDWAGVDLSEINTMRANDQVISSGSSIDLLAEAASQVGMV